MCLMTTFPMVIVIVFFAMIIMIVMLTMIMCLKKRTLSEIKQLYAIYV